MKTDGRDLMMTQLFAYEPRVSNTNMTEHHDPVVTLKLTLKNSLFGCRLLALHVLTGLHPYKGMIILRCAPSHLDR